MKYDSSFNIQLLDPIQKLDFLIEQLDTFQRMLEDVSTDLILERY